MNLKWESNYHDRMHFDQFMNIWVQNMLLIFFTVKFIFHQVSCVRLSQVIWFPHMRHGNKQQMKDFN